MLAPGLPREEGSIPPRLSCARSRLKHRSINTTFSVAGERPLCGRYPATVLDANRTLSMIPSQARLGAYAPLKAGPRCERTSSPLH